MKRLRIVNDDGRAAQFGSRQELALGILHLLRTTKQGLEFQHLVQELAKSPGSCTAARVHAVLQKLHYAGVISGGKGKGWVLAARFTVCNGPRTALPYPRWAGAEQAHAKRIRIVTDAGQAVQFALQQGLALRVLALLQTARQGMLFGAIVAQLALEEGRATASEIDSVLRKLRSVGLVRREKSGLHSLTATYSVEALPAPSLVARAARHRWNHVDWTLTNCELAARLGVTWQRVRQVRRERGAPASPFETGARHLAAVRQEWEKVDWTLADCELAARLGVTRKRVRQVRRERGAPVSPFETVARRLAAVRQKWEKVDWTLADCELAARLGVTRERVRQVRRAQGAPDSPFKALPSAVRALLRWLRSHHQRAMRLTPAQVGAAAGIVMHPASIARHMAAEGIKSVLPRPWRRPTVNWALPNCDLSDVWGYSARKVATLRSRGHHGRAHWDRRGGRRLGNQPDFEEYRQALESERRKAGAYYRWHPERRPRGNAATPADRCDGPPR